MPTTLMTIGLWGELVLTAETSDCIVGLHSWRTSEVNNVPSFQWIMYYQILSHGINCNKIIAYDSQWSIIPRFRDSDFMEQPQAAKKTKWYSIREAAEYLDVGEPTIYRWMREGKITFRKVGDSTRFWQ